MAKDKEYEEPLEYWTVAEGWVKIDEVPVYTAPPQRPWVGLTDEEWESMYDKFAKHQEYGAFVSGWGDFARAIEAALKDKNGL